MGKAIEAFFKNAPDIITAAAKSPLGIIALALLVLAVLCLALFRTSGSPVKVTVFLSVLVVAVFFCCLAAYYQMKQSGSPGTAASAPPENQYGYAFRKVTWKNTYLKDYGFKGEIETSIKNVSKLNQTLLPPQEGSWWGWGEQSFELRPVLYDKAELSHQLQQVYLTHSQRTRRDIDGSEWKYTLYAWQFEVQPCVAPGEELRYGEQVTTKGTERDAFTEKGSVAGMWSPFPVDLLCLEVHAPEGYRFDGASHFVKDKVGAEIRVDGAPKLSSDGSLITWEVPKPIPSAQYFVRVKFVQ